MFPSYQEIRPIEVLFSEQMRHFPSNKLKIDTKHAVMLQMLVVRNEKGQLWKPAGLETCDDVKIEDQLKKNCWDEPEEQTSQ